MFRNLWSELRHFLNLVADKSGMQGSKQQIAAGGADVYGQFRRSPKWHKGLLIVAIVALCIIIPITLFTLSANNPKVARLFHVSVPVEGYRVKVSQITQLIGASGVVAPHASIQLISRVNGSTVLKVPVVIGNIVKAGTTLLESDQSTYAPSLVAAQEAVIAAQISEKRSEAVLVATQEMMTKGLAEQIQIEQAQADLAKAKQDQALTQSAAATAQADMDFTRLKAPLDSIVLSREIDPGETLVLNAPVMTLGDIHSVYLVALVQEENLPYTAVGQSAEVVFSSLPTQTFRGVIEKIDPTVSQTSRTYNAFVLIRNDNLLLKPGVTGFARIAVTALGLVIPEAAVMNQYSEVANVFVVDSNSRAVLTPVRLGLRGEGGYQVLSGLHEGDTVVSVGTQYLKENELVHVNYQ